MSEICGAATKTTGEPCKLPSERCPHHGPDAVGNPGAGRPSKYATEACDVVLRLGRKGASRAEWAEALDIGIQTLYDWEERYPEFSESTSRARDLAQAWWERQGRKGVWGRDFNASAYRLQMMNRFPDDWRDKKSLEHSGPEGGPIEHKDVNEAREHVENELDDIADRLQERRAAVSLSGNGGQSA